MSGDVEQAVNHGASDALVPELRRGVHGFLLAVGLVELSQRTDGRQRTGLTRAEERDRRVQEPVEVEGMHVTRRGVLPGKGEKPFE